MNDVILVAAGDLPQVVLNVSRNTADLTAFGDAEGQAFLVDYDIHPQPPVCADQIWNGLTATEAPMAFGQRKAAKRAAIIAASDAAFAAGFTVSTGSLAGQTLQVRTTEDRTNWLTSQATYGAAVAAGQGAVEGAMFRTASNQIFTLSFQEAYGVLVQGMAAWGQSIYAKLWALKDAIDAAENETALDAIDVTAGWP